MRKVRNWVIDFCKYASTYEGSYIYRFWSAIAVISATLERRCWIPLGEHETFPNLYIFLIGDAGTRKSSTANLAMSMLKEVPEIKLIQDRLTPAVLIKALQEVERSFQIGTRIIQHSSAFAYASELRVLLEDIGGGSLISLLTDFYDSRRHGEKFISRTMKGGQSEITGPGLTFLGCSTPDWFMEVIPHYAIGGGFTSRVIFVVQSGSMERPIPEPEMPNLQLRSDLVETIRHIHDLVGAFSMTKEARSEYNSWYTQFMTQSAKTMPDDRFKGYAMRKGDFVRKLAMVFCAAQRDSMLIDEFDIVLAIEALTSIEPAMMQAFGPIGESPRAKNIARLFYRIPEYPEEISHSELLRLNWYHVTDAKQFSAEIEVLTMAGAVTRRIAETTQRIFYSRVPSFDLMSAVKKLDKIEPRVFSRERKPEVTPINSNNGNGTNGGNEHASEIESPVSPDAGNLTRVETRSPTERPHLEGSSSGIHFGPESEGPTETHSEEKTLF